MADERDDGALAGHGDRDGRRGRGDLGGPGRPGGPGEHGGGVGDPDGGDGSQGTAGVDANAFVRDFLIAVAAVVVLAGLLFGVSGIWPPLVAVESGSMEPNLQVGDLVYVVDNDRFVPAGAMESTGVVPADRAAETGYRSFGGHGDVVVFIPDGDPAKTPIIHRAMLWVEAGENWYDRADPGAVGGAGGCAELTNCPAPHAGFVTLGDNNEMYDQATPRTGPVRPSWIVGTAELRVPLLGHVRLAFAGSVAPVDGGVATLRAAPTGGAAGPVGPASPSRHPTGGDEGAASAPPAAAAGIV